MKSIHFVPFLFAALLLAQHASAQYQSQPTEESKKLPPGSAAERKARMSGRANAVAYTAFTGSYDYVGWQNNFVIIVNKDNPLAKITLQQLDGIFGSARDGGWVGTTWHPEFSRGPEQDIRKWGQLGLTGEWADKRINVHGYSLRYATAIEFSDKVLQASDKWNGDLHAYGNYRRPDGTTYLEADQIIDHVRKDPTAVGYVRFHQGLPKEIKVLPLARTSAPPSVR